VRLSPPCAHGASLVAEILVLRQQLAVLKRDRPRPPLRPIDRAFWVVVSRVWSRWPDALAIVKPATVIAWHRRGFARFWAWKSRRIGRPPLEPEIVELIVRIAGENPLWSRRRIANELPKLGHDVSKDAVAKYMPKPPRRPRRPPSQTWKTFLRNHRAGTIAIDFLTVPTVTFNVLYVFFVLSLERRRVLHVNVTAHPYAAWTAQQVVEAIGADIVPLRQIRDRDASSAGSSTRGWTTWASGRSASRRALLGKTDTRKDGWAHCAASCSIP
jgi:putative transposase